VADKGYHSKMVMLALRLGGWRSYIAEPRRGRQNWEGEAEERDAVYANRRRKNGHRGRHLMRLRGEIIERTFAHVLETGGMRRLYLCHQENIANGCWCTLPVTTWVCSCASASALANRGVSRASRPPLGCPGYTLEPPGFAHAAARARRPRESARPHPITRPVARSRSRMSEAIHTTKTTGC